MGQPLQLESFDLHQLAELEHELDRTLCVVLKVSTNKATQKLEKRIASVLTKAWKGTATAALRKYLPAVTPTQRSINAFLKRIGVSMKKPLTVKQIKFVTSQLDAIWKVSKRIAAKEIGVKVSFSLVDAKAVTAISRHQVLWAGDFYSEQLSERIRAVTEDIMLKQGFSASEAAPVLRDALAREMGLTPGGKTAWAELKPARYAADPDRYFRQLAGTTSHQSRTFGKMTEFNEAEVVTYRLINPDDRRTGKICQHMSGQVFSVQVGVKHMNKLLGAKDPTDVKAIAPWLSGNEIEERLDGARTGSKAASARLAQAGAILPPFHSACRTEPVIIS